MTSIPFQSLCSHYTDTLKLMASLLYVTSLEGLPALAHVQRTFSCSLIRAGSTQILLMTAWGYMLSH